MCCDLCDFYIHGDEIDVMNSNCCLKCGEYNECSGEKAVSAYGDEEDFDDFDEDLEEDDDLDDNLDDDDFDDDEDEEDDDEGDFDVEELT